VHGDKVVSVHNGVDETVEDCEAMSGANRKSRKGLVVARVVALLQPPYLWSGICLRRS